MIKNFHSFFEKRYNFGDIKYLNTYKKIYKILSFENEKILMISTGKVNMMNKIIFSVNDILKKFIAQ